MLNYSCSSNIITRTTDHTAQLTPMQGYSKPSLSSRDALELIVQASIPKVGTNFICFTLGAGQGSTP